jgi:hypothetical protein
MGTQCLEVYLSHPAPGVINRLDWPTRLGVEQQDDNLSSCESEQLGNINCGLGTEWNRPGQWTTINEMRIVTWKVQLCTDTY